MLNALRLAQGVPASLFAERTGYPLAIVSRAPDEACARVSSSPIRESCAPLSSAAASRTTFEIFLPAARPGAIAPPDHGATEWKR